MLTKRILLTVFISFIFLYNVNGSNQVLELKGLNEKHNLAPYISYFRSSDIADTSTHVIIDAKIQKKFIKNQQKEINFKTTKDIFWFRFNAVNLTSDNYWYLTVDYPPLSDITLFLRHDDGTIEEIPSTRSGSHDKTIIQDHTSFVFRLNLVQNELHTVFIRVNTTSLLLLPVSIMSTGPFLQKSINRYTILFLILAILIASLVLNITLLISTRDRTYLLLILIVIGILFVSWYQFGFGIDFFPELNMYFKNRMRVLVSVFTCLIFNLFTIRFLELSDYRIFRNFYKILNIILLFYFALILLPISPIRWMNFINPSFLTILFLVNYTMGIIATFRKTRTTIYYLPGLSLVIVTALTGVLLLYGIISYHPILSHINMFAASLFCLSVTFGLREKIVKLQQEHKRSAHLKELNERLLSEILKRKQTEIELRQSNDFLKAEQQNTQLLLSAIESTTSTIVITNVKAEIEYVNPGFSQVTGYSPEEVYGKNPSILKTDHHPKEYYEKLWETILSGKSWKGEFLNKKKDGNVYWESAVITPVVDSQTGEITHFVAVKDDMTELKNIMLDLEKSEKKQKEINASRNKLFSIIGHDLMNPFNALLGFNQILTENLTNANDERNLEYAGMVNASAQKIIKLLQNLLVWAGQQTGIIRFDPRKVNPKDLIIETIAYVQPAAQEKGIRISFSVQENLQLELDYQMTATILRNLLWNAVNFSNEGDSVSVTVKADKQEACFSVTDTGQGMEHEQLKKLFITDPGTAKNSNHVESGFGLGLILCRDLAEAHHGEIMADSAPGKGSTFTFKFPLSFPEHCD